MLTVATDFTEISFKVSTKLLTQQKKFNPLFYYEQKDASYVNTAHLDYDNRYISMFHAT